MQNLFLFIFLFFIGYQAIGQTCSGSVGDNIFPDGDFGKGTDNILQLDPGLAPGYRYQFNPPPNDGFYCITNNTTTWGSFAAVDWINIGDNSGDPNGYMMVVNASFAPGLFYEKTVTVCGNTNYEFSADIIAMNDPTRGSNFIAPNISFLINGVEKFSSGNVPIDARWHTYGFTFTTDSAATEIKLAVRNNAPGGFGNDLALDNISFRPCGPTVALIDTAGFCTSNRQITINSKVIGSAFANPVFQWQKSPNKDSSWMDIPNITNQSLNLSNPADGQYFRLTVASSAANLSQKSCRIASNPTRVTYLPNRDTLIATICKGDTIQINNKPIFQAGNLNITSKAVNGCDSVTTFIIKIEDLSYFKIEGDTILCKGETDTLRARNFVLYNWSTNASTANVTINNPGTYAVTVTSIYGCIAKDTILVNSSGINDFFVNLIPPLCSNSRDGILEIVNIEGDSPPFLYRINENPLQNINKFENLAGGTYQIVVQNNNGCEQKITVPLLPPPKFEMRLSSPTKIELGDSTLITAITNQPSTRFNWKIPKDTICSNCLEIFVSPLRTTFIQLTAFNTNNCPASDSVQIFVQNSKRVYAPTAFSPNSDGVNDLFELFTGNSVKSILEVHIFDRWGNELFTSKKESKWNGYYNGQLAPNGTYVWTASVQFIDDSIKQLQGDVTLIR